MNKAELKKLAHTSLVKLKKALKLQAPANADPYVSIMAKDGGTVPLGKYGQIEIVAGNGGNMTIARNSLELIVSAGNNARITSLVASSRWKLKTLSKEKTGNTARLVNKVAFGSFDLAYEYLRVHGVAKKGSIIQTVSSNVHYITANNPEIGGALNASQGNASNTNDNSTTSITVV